jgi:hypothetical protein
LLAGLILAGAVAAQPVEFKGLALGSTQAELEQQFPSLTCRAPPPAFQSLGEQHCTADYAACALRHGTNCDGEAALRTYAGSPSWGHAFEIVRGRVEKFSLVVHPRDYETVRNALVEARGAGKETRRVVQTGAGAQVESRTWEIQGANGSIAVYEHADRIDEALVVGETAAFKAWRAERVPVAAKKGSKDL